MLSRTSRILLVAAVLAVGAYLLIDRKTERGEGESARLATFDIARVDGVILERESETLRFAREDSLWRMTAPVSDVAEPSTVISLLDALEHADIARNLGATDDLAPFGLAPPLLRITVLAGSDTLLSAAFGKRTVDDAWSYARTGSNDLLLVPTNISRAATLPTDGYRNRRVVDFQLRDVEEYEFSATGRSMVWTRRARDWYTVIEGDTVAGDSVAVESVLRRLRGLRVASFLPTVRAADTDRFLGISLWRAGRTPLARVGFHCAPDGMCQGFEAWSGNRSFVVEGDMEDLFGHTITSLRDRRLLQFAPTSAERIEVALPDASGTIVRSGGRWSFPNPALGRIDAEHAADFVRALRALKWTDVAPATPPGLAPSRFSVTVTDAGGTILDEMRADPRPDGRYFVTSRSSRGVWMIEREHLATLADRFARLKAP